MAGAKIEALSTQVICKQPGRYIGWPTIAKTAQEELLVVFSGDRDSHVCPYGKTQLVRSSDGGAMWSAPETINDTPVDDRDAGVIVTRSGAIVVSWFTGVASEARMLRYREQYGDETADRWQATIDSLTQEDRREGLGHWVRRSEDGGKTWDAPVRTTESAPHGPIELSDGRLLYVGRTIFHDEEALLVEQSPDDGRTWALLGRIEIPPDESIDSYHEPHVVEVEDGRLLAMVRYVPPDRSRHFLRQAMSEDGGATWTVAEATPIWGYPPHLIRLHNGWLLVVYGKRRPPYGEYACISRDGGTTWEAEDELLVCASHDADLGYPASVQQADGSIWTVYYQKDKPDEKPCLMGTHWRVPGT